MKDKLSFLAEILEKNEIKVTPEIPHGLTLNKINQAGIYNWLNEAFETLEGIPGQLERVFNHHDQLLNHEILKINDKFIYLDTAVHFNRYRKRTLGNPLYENMDALKTEDYRRYCRKYEKECLKSGSRKGIWNGEIASEIFGPAADVGDFGLNGPTGWKMNAFVDFLEDLRNYIFNYQWVRVSVYETIMINGKLHTLDDLFLSRNETKENYLVKFFQRRLAHG